jgi:hypothetical protein
MALIALSAIGVIDYPHAMFCSMVLGQKKYFFSAGKSQAVCWEMSLKLGSLD